MVRKDTDFQTANIQYFHATDFFFDKYLNIALKRQKTASNKKGYYKSIERRLRQAVAVQLDSEIEMSSQVT